MATDYENLRVEDLIAKTARVTLKDTVRVLMAFDMLVDFLGSDPDDLLYTTFADTQVRPSPENAEACNMAFEDFKAWLKINGEDDWLANMRAID